MKCQFCQKEATTKFDRIEVCQDHAEAMEYDRHRFDDENEKENEDE